MKILLVDDDKVLIESLRYTLKEEGYDLDVAETAEAGLARAEKEEYQLFILDRMLPGKDGIWLCQVLREQNIETPILFLTAMAAPEDRVVGLDLGGDDYLVKPFSFEELLARVRALLRRPRVGDQISLRIGDLVLDPLRRQVERAGQVVELTPREFKLLDYLMRRPGQVVSRSVLAEKVWNQPASVRSNVVDVYINYLRNKLGDEGPARLIHTVRGVGYVMRPNTQADSPAASTQRWQGEAS